MGHKIHPSGLRLGITQEHRSKWFASSKTYPILLQEDFKIRTFIQKKYGAAGISDVLIARKADQLELELKTARPGVIVGRQGSGIEELRSGIQKTIGDRTRQVRINVVEVERVDADAFLLAEYIAQQLEKRVAFRRTIRMALQRAQRAGVLGLKIQVGGRLNGAEIARTEWTRDCLLYTSPSPRDAHESRMPSSACFNLTCSYPATVLSLESKLTECDSITF